MTAVRAPQPGVTRPSASHGRAHRCARADALPRSRQAGGIPPRPQARRVGRGTAADAGSPPAIPPSWAFPCLRREESRRTAPPQPAPAKRGPVRAGPLRCREALALLAAVAPWPPQAEPRALP